MFGKGLPGYDAWLDNYGNPGMGDGMLDSEFRWALDEPVLVTQIHDGDDTSMYCVVRESNKDEFIHLTFEKGKSGHLLFNGNFVDVGDDFIGYVSLIDDYHEHDGEPGKTLRLEPFEDEEEPDREMP